MRKDDELLDRSEETNSSREDIFQTLLKQVEISAQVSQAISSAENLEDLYFRVVDNVKEKFNFYHVQLLRYDPDIDAVKLIAGYGDVGRVMLSQDHQMPMGKGLIGVAAATGKTILRADVSLDPDWRSNPLLPGTQAEIATPIKWMDEVLGVLDVQSDVKGELGTETQLLLEGLCGQIAIAIQHQRIVDRFHESETALAQERNNLRSLIDNLPDVIYYKDTQSRMLLVNQAQADLLGAPTPLDAIGKTDYDFFSPEFASKYYQDEQNLFASGNNLTVEEQTIDPQGNPKWINTTKIMLRDDEGKILGLVGIGRDITERRAAELLVAKRAKQLATVAEISTVVSATLDVQELLQIAAEMTRKGFDLYHCHIFMLREESQNLQIQACSWAEDSPYWNTHCEIEIDLEKQQSLVARAARTRVPILVNDVTQDPGWLQNPRLPNTLSEMSVPLLVADTLLGVLDVQANSINYFTTEDANIQTTLAAQIATALQTARQYERAQQALQITETLYAGTGEIIKAQSAQEVLNALVKATTIKKFQRAFILLFDKVWDEAPPQAYRAEAVWQAGEATNLVTVGTVFPHDRLPIANIADPERVSIVLDVDTDKRINDELRDVLKQLMARSVALFPLVSTDGWIGTLMIFTEDIMDISEADIRQISNLTSQAAAVIRGQQLHQGLAERVQELTNLQRLMSQDAWAAYSSARKVETVGYLFDQVSVNPVFDPQGFFPTDANNIDYASQPSTIYSTNLEVQGQVIGYVGLQNETGVVLTQDEQGFLEELADNVSKALERARLIEQTQKSTVELQTVAEVSSAASTILEPGELLQSVVDLTKNRFNLYHAHVYILDEEGKKLTLTAGAGEIGRSMTAEGWAIMIDEQSLVARAARTGEGQLVNDVQLEPGFLPNPLLPDTASELAVPMIVGSRVLGVFDVQSYRVNAFSEGDLATYSTLATQTAVALQNARLFAEQFVIVERLRELDHLKSTFLANMSHELRTPLNSILGFTQVILEEIDGPLTEYMASDLQLIEKNGKHLLNLINEVLDMAKIESGRMSLSLESIDLRELIADILETTTPQARAKSIYLQADYRPDADLVISADLMRLRQILLNLVGNAIKFTETGGITVAAQRQGDMVHIQVKDTGIGIPPEKLETIFEAFSQVDTSTTRKAGGTGLGLPISRRLVEMHGGRLWAESQGFGFGSVLYLEMPLQPKQ